MRPFPPTPPARDERGVVLSTRLLALAISAVAVAALVFVANDPDEVGRADEATPVTSEPEPSTSPTATPSAEPSKQPAKKKKPKPIKRGETYVVVFNNTGITGLAGGVAGKAEAGGWNVVGSDNWYGTVDGTAVYYPPRLEAAGKALGKDLGIARVKPSVEPMQFDRLTVILTDDYQG